MSRLSPEREEARRALHAAGASDSEIASTEGIRKATIAQWRSVNGLSTNVPRGRPKGALAPWSNRPPLPPPEDILRWRAEGLTHTEIGARCGRSREWARGKLQELAPLDNPAKKG